MNGNGRITRTITDMLLARSEHSSKRFYSMSNEMKILQKEYYEVNERQRKIINMQFDGFLGKLTSGKWAKIGKCSTDTALNDIKNLLGKGVLRKNDEVARFAFRTNERTNKRGASRRDRSQFRLFLSRKELLNLVPIIINPSRMESRKHLAAEKKRCNSHNCAQSVVCTYCDLVGLPEQTALDITGAYGTGMGNMEGTCGAIVGAGMILGLATKDRNLSRSRMRQIMEMFQKRNGATQCKLLKGVGTGKPLRDCPDCVADASEFLEEILEDNQ